MFSYGFKRTIEYLKNNTGYEVFYLMSPKRGFYMSKLTYEDKINLYKDRKFGLQISALCSKYKILHANVEYLTRLIDKHGYDVLRTSKNRKYTQYEKENIINRVLLNNE